MNIGIFDSGLGGLTVLKKCHELMPEYNYVYLADNAHLPYGSKSKEEIYELTKTSVEFLFNQDCKIVVVACNTATANALRTLQQEWLPTAYPDRRILGVIRPAVETVVDSQGKRVGVMATEASVRSNAFEEELKKLDPTIEVFEQACPKFVPLIEGREILTEVQDDTSVKDSSQARMTEEDRKAKQMMQDTFLQLIIKQYLDPLLHNNIDTLLLGCTHYELIQDQIKQQLPPTVTLISEGTTCATKLKEYLNRHHEIEETLTQNRQLTLNFTLDTKEYREKASAYLS